MPRFATRNVRNKGGIASPVHNSTARRARPTTTRKRHAAPTTKQTYHNIPRSNH